MSYLTKEHIRVGLFQIGLGVGILVFLLIYLADIGYNLNDFELLVFITEYLKGLPVTMILGVFIVRLRNSFNSDKIKESDI